MNTPLLSESLQHSKAGNVLLPTPDGGIVARAPFHGASSQPQISCDRMSALLPASSSRRLQPVVYFPQPQPVWLQWQATLERERNNKGRGGVGVNGSEYRASGNMQYHSGRQSLHPRGGLPAGIAQAKRHHVTGSHPQALIGVEDHAAAGNLPVSQQDQQRRWQIPSAGISSRTLPRPSREPL